MATAAARRTLDEIIDLVAQAIGRHGVAEGEARGADAALRIELEENVRRQVQVYWTAFEADVPGFSIGLHLEVAEPRVHWAEGYIAPDDVSWVFFFAERPADGEIQLLYYEQYESPEEAIEGFFDLSSWHILTATDKSWSDVVYQVADDVGWRNHERARASGTAVQAAVQESLKKSTILWMRWRADGREHTMPVWYVYDQKVGKVYILSGERQQRIPGAERLQHVDLIFRWKGKNARVADVHAYVRVLEPGPEWDEVAEKVAEKRLNIPGLPEETARRWRDECVLLELTLS